jgi:hypothetical protein
MEVESKAFHSTNHYGMNRFEEACNNRYLRFPRSLMRKVVGNCLVCSQSQPLKTRERQVHITATRPMERLMIDLIDMSQYIADNEGFAWIMSVLDVFSKFAWAIPLKN